MESTHQLLLFWLRARGLEIHFPVLTEYGVESVEDLERFMDLARLLEAGLPLEGALQLQACLQAGTLRLGANYSGSSPRCSLPTPLSGGTTTTLGMAAAAGAARLATTSSSATGGAGLSGRGTWSGAVAAPPGARRGTRAQKWLRSLPTALSMCDKRSPFECGAPRLSPGQYVLYHPGRSSGEYCECSFASSSLAPEYRRMRARPVDPLCPAAVAGRVCLVDSARGFATVQILIPASSPPSVAGRHRQQQQRGGGVAVSSGTALVFSGVEAVLDCARLRPLDAMEDGDLGLVVVHDATGVAARSAHLRQQQPQQQLLSPRRPPNASPPLTATGTGAGADDAGDTAAAADSDCGDASQAEMDRGLIRYSELMLAKCDVVLRCCATIVLGTDGSTGGGGTGDTGNANSGGGAGRMQGTPSAALRWRDAVEANVLSILGFSFGCSVKLERLQPLAAGGPDGEAGTGGLHAAELFLSFVGYAVRHRRVSFNPLNTSVESFLRIVISLLLPCHGSPPARASLASGIDPRPSSDAAGGTDAGGGGAVVALAEVSSIVVQSVAEIPDVKDATLTLSPTPLPLGSVVSFVNLDHHPNYPSGIFANPRYLLGQILNDIVTPTQMLYVVAILEPVHDNVGFAFGQPYRAKTSQAIIAATQAIRVPRFRKDAFGRFHVSADLEALWRGALLHRVARGTERRAGGSSGEGRAASSPEADSRSWAVPTQPATVRTPEAEQ